MSVPPWGVAGKVDALSERLSTLGARELAERIGRGIKSLRTKIGSTVQTDEKDPTA